MSEQDLKSENHKLKNEVNRLRAELAATKPLASTPQAMMNKLSSEMAFLESELAKHIAVPEVKAILLKLSQRRSNG